MGQDVSQEIASQISDSKVFGSSDNIRHGKYRFLIKRIFAELVETDHGNNKMAFWEFKVVKSEPNPQIEGDVGVDGKLIDDGTKPNPVGSDCALKINFDGPGARSAGSNIKQAVLALFNKSDGEVDDAQINKTWVDLARRKGVKKGDTVGFDEATRQVLVATEDKQGNPACGMVLDCVTRAKKKKVANDKGAYITKLIFVCASPIGMGENAPELVAKRRAEIEATQVDDDDAEETAPRAPASPSAPVQTQAVAPPPPAPSAPPPPAQSFMPQVPWVKHPTTPGWFWSDPSLGGNNAVKNEEQLRAGQ